MTIFYISHVMINPAHQDIMSKQCIPLTPNSSRVKLHFSEAVLKHVFIIFVLSSIRILHGQVISNGIDNAEGRSRTGCVL